MKGILMKPWKIKFIRDHPDTEIQMRGVIKPQPLHNMIEQIWQKPRYKVGETVYIKEAHYRHGHYDNGHFIPSLVKRILFDIPEILPISPRQVGWHKRSPLFMPARSARYFIKITGVRAERLQSITEEDIQAEGEPYMSLPEEVLLDFGYTEPYHYVKEHFAYYWDSINGKYPWASTPYVWVYIFHIKHY